MPGFVMQLYYISTHRCETNQSFVILLNSIGVLLFHPILLSVVSVLHLWTRGKSYWDTNKEEENYKEDEVQTISCKVILLGGI